MKEPPPPPPGLLKQFPEVTVQPEHGCLGNQPAVASPDGRSCPQIPQLGCKRWTGAELKKRTNEGAAEEEEVSSLSRFCCYGDEHGTSAASGGVSVTRVSSPAVVFHSPLKVNQIIPPRFSLGCVIWASISPPPHLRSASPCSCPLPKPETPGMRLSSGYNHPSVYNCSHSSGGGGEKERKTPAAAC